MFKFLLPFLAFLAVTLTGRAQSVRWEPGSGTLALNQLSELSLVFDQCEPKNDTVTLPAVPGLTFTQPPNRSQQTSVNVVNFKASSSKTVTLTYRVRPTEHRPLTIPAFQIDTDKGRQTVLSATFEIGDATVGQSSLSLTDIASANLVSPEKPVWQGQVFDLRYNLVIRGNRPFRPSNNLNWNKDPLIVESWSSPVETQASGTGQPESIITQTTRAFARTAGTFKLGAAEQDVIIATGQDIFGRATGTNFTISSQPASVTVKPLPSPAPAGFSGAVGQFTLDSKIVPATAAVGEPITWTLTFDGTGNWPDIAGLPARSVSKDFRIVQPQAKRTAKGNAIFDASITEDIVLIPTKPGAYTLGPVSISIFNPATGAYETLSTKPVTIQITPADLQLKPPSSTPASSAPSDLQSKLPPSTGSAALPAAATPAPLPRDPLPPAGTACAPLSNTAVLIGLLSSVLCPLILWAVLAVRRARVTDPARPLREAHARLTATLRQLASNSQPSTLNAQLIQSWQRDTAILWRLPQAVPTLSSFLAGLDQDSSPASTNAEAAWSTLWAEADHTLYGTAPLPADWPARAQAALAARPAPAFSSFQLFLPRNLLPLVLLIGSVLCLPAPSGAAETASASDLKPKPSASTVGATAYRAADFPAAEAAWRDALKAAPTDWTAHHNLALALLQQNRAPEAAGHALAAFVQQPQNPSVRWQLGYAWKTAGVTPVALKPFLTDAAAATLASLASPTRWQAALIASAWLGALALSLGLYTAYTRAGTRLKLKRATSTAMAAAAIALALAAGVSLKTYGPLADTRAVVVVTPTTLRSIPTDLDTPQKSSPLGVGVVATTDKTFLGWRRLVFPDGQTGWVRAETLVPLWR